MADGFASAFQTGIQSAESDREYLLRKAQFDAQAPIRAAQVSLLGSQIQSANTKATMDALAASNAVKAQGSMAEALAFQGELDGDYSGDNEARFLKFASERPWLVNTPWFQGVAKDFDVAKQLNSKATLLEQQIEGRSKAAEARAEAAANVANIKAQSAKDIADAKAAKDLEIANLKTKHTDERRRQADILYRTTVNQAMKLGKSPAKAKKEASELIAENFPEFAKAPESPATPEQTDELTRFYEARKQNPALTYKGFTAQPTQGSKSFVRDPKTGRLVPAK